MHAFITVLIRILEGMFIVGMTGSVIVLVLATIEDIRTMIEKDEPTEKDDLGYEIAESKRERRDESTPRVASP